MIEAQIVESFLLNTITFQSMVASKAARVAIAARATNPSSTSLCAEITEPTPR